jgi:hypothetical protein
MRKLSAFSIAILFLVAAQSLCQEIVVTNDTVLEKDAVLR